MNKKTARLREALRLNALEDMREHTELSSHHPHDLCDLKKLNDLIAANAPKKAKELYSGLDTFIREHIPESLDDWLKATC